MRIKIKSLLTGKEIILDTSGFTPRPLIPELVASTPRPPAQLLAVDGAVAMELKSDGTFNVYVKNEDLHIWDAAVAAVVNQTPPPKAELPQSSKQAFAELAERLRKHTDSKRREEIERN